MSSRARTGWLLSPILILTAAAHGCRGTHSSGGATRVAVLPFANLSTSPGDDWIGAVLPYLFQAQAPQTNRILLPATSESDVRFLRATHAVRGYYEVKPNGIRLVCQLRDLARLKTVQREETSVASAADVGKAAAELLRRLGEGEPKPVSWSEAALKQAGGAFLTDEPQARLEQFRAAWEAQPQMAFAASAATEILLASGRSEEARRLLERAIPAAGEGANALRLRLALATIERDNTKALAALEELVQLLPEDSDLTRRLGETLQAMHRTSEAVTWFRKTTELEPNQPLLWNQLAYAQAYSRQFDDALQSVDRYEKLAPNDPNVRDTRGEILWMAGRFSDAADSFLKAQEKDPQFLGGIEFAKSAFAQFLAEQPQAADQTFARYLESRRAAKDPLVDVRQAHWLRLTGRGKQAMAAMQKLAGGEGEAAARAGAFLSTWYLLDGNRPEALRWAQAAARQARTPPSINLAATAAFLAQPDASPEEWRSRAGRAVNLPAARQLLLGYALLVNGHEKEAAQVLDAIYRENAPERANEVRALLAVARLRGGDRKGSEELLAVTPLPPQPGESLLAILWFPLLKKR